MNPYRLVCLLSLPFWSKTYFSSILELPFPFLVELFFNRPCLPYHFYREIVRCLRLKWGWGAIRS